MALLARVTFLKPYLQLCEAAVGMRMSCWFYKILKLFRKIYWDASGGGKQRSGLVKLNFREAHLLSQTNLMERFLRHPREHSDNLMKRSGQAINLVQSMYLERADGYAIVDNEFGTSNETRFIRSEK